VAQTPGAVEPVAVPEPVAAAAAAEPARVPAATAVAAIAPGDGAASAASASAASAGADAEGGNQHGAGLPGDLAGVPAAAGSTTGAAGSATASGGSAGASGAAVGGATGHPASGGGNALPDLSAVRRRIEARKVYPQIAIRNGWEGLVLVEMHLEGDGRLSTVRLVQGSGFPILDEATIHAVRRASPFPPVARVVTVPVEYRLVP
jgi:TonB family protein